MKQIWEDYYKENKHRIPKCQCGFRANVEIRFHSVDCEYSYMLQEIRNEWKNIEEEI